MGTYAIGDIQGCFSTLVRLLERIEFDPARDRLWSVGDLVNRGPRSLEVLRWARSLGDRLVVVLGNHDIHLLARWQGVRHSKPGDTVDPVLAASDCDELLEWLASRPLIHREDSFVMVHAGLLPNWTVEQAEALSREVESALRGDGRKRLLRNLVRDREPLEWHDASSDAARLRLIVKALTRLRVCTAAGRLCPGFSGPPEEAPPGCLPWFDVADRSSREATVICGHWSALGLYVRPDVIALDSGCVWGRQLTAFRLEDRKVFQEPMADH